VRGSCPGGTDTLISIENLIGSSFDDTLVGNAGDNSLDGGDGADTVSYAAAAAGVTISLAVSGPQNTGGAGTDTLISIENLIGSTYNDTLIGSSDDNILIGGGGNDTVSGGPGRDVAVYSGVATDYQIARQGGGFLITDLRSGSPDGADHLTNIEQVRFTNGATISLRAPVPGDFNADGASDILWRNDNGDALLWLGNPGAGAAFASQAAGTNAASSQVAGFGDVDGDGRSDILWRNADGSASLWLANPGGGFTAQSLGSAPASWHLLGAADFNGDGKGDIVWRNDSGQVSVWTSSPGQGLNFTFTGFSAPASWHLQEMADLNGDGRADPVWRNDNGDTAAWLTDANLGFSFFGLGVQPTSWQILDVADFNGDGRGDFLWRNVDSGLLSVWQSDPGPGLNISFPLFSPGSGAAPPNWHIEDVADFNGDGRADILWRNADNGQASEWLTTSGPTLGFTPVDPGLAQSNAWHIQADWHGV